MAESYSVTAVLSAQDKNFSSVFGSARNAADSLAGKLKSGLGFGVLVGIGQKAFSALSSSVSGFTSELEGTSAAWQTFTKNAEMNGHTAKEIAKTKKELQSFAQQTIYSASDMATTYAQLDAVGIKSAKSLVKGFGGLAAAAENPTQAMKTLSQQGVQMAAKPKVAWQDFKLMLEQTPAGIAAVAKEMGMSTSEMVQAVQDGEIATNDFFKAVQKVGTSDAFTELATSYKTTGQALDGLSETVTNTLMPSFELFQGRAIKAVEKVIEKVEAFDGQKIADTIGSIFDAFDSGGITGAIGEVTGLLDKLPEGFKAAAAAAGALGAVNIANSILDSGVWKMGMAGISSFSNFAGALPGKMGGILSKTTGAFSKFNPVKTINKSLNGARRSFKNFGSAMDAFGGDVAASLEAISPKLSNAGLKIWGAFDSVGNGVSSKGSKIVGSVKKSFNGLSQTVGSAASAISGRAGTILKPFQTILGGITGFLGKIGGAVLGVGGQLASGLQTMMGIALKALMPAAMIGAALAGLGLLQEKFGEQIDGILSMVQEKGPQIISNFANGISSRVPELISQGATLVGNLLNTIGSLAPSLVSAGVQIITSLVGGVAQSAPQLISGAVTAVGGFASGIISAIPTLIVSGMQLLLGVAQGISQNLPRMAQGAVQAVQNFAQNLITNLPTILSIAGQIITTLVQGLTSALPALASGAVSIIATLATGFIQNLPQIIQTGVQVIASLAIGIVQGIATLISMIPSLFGTVVNTIMTTDWISVGGQIIEAIGNGITGAIGGLGEKVSGFFSGIGDWFSGGEKAGTDYVTGATASITASAPQVTGAAQQVATDVSANTVDFFTNSGTAGGQGLMTGFSTGVLDNMGTMTDSVTNMMQSTSDMLNDSSIQSDADSAGQDIVQSAASGIDAGASAAETAIQSTMTSAISALSTSATEAQTAGQDIGTAVVDGFTVAMEPLADAAQQAVSNAVTAMQSGLSAMQSAGQQAGARFAAGIRTGLTQASTAAKTSVKAITAALKSSVSPAQAAGRNAGSRFAAGIRAGVSAARSAGNAAGKAAVSGMKSGASGAHSAGSSAGSRFASGVSSKTGSARSAGSSLAHAARSGMSGVSTSSIGSYMGQGLVNGLNSKYGAVAAAARRLANAAAQAMRNAAKVASPSKVTTEIGEYIAAGLYKGIASGKDKTVKAATSLAKSVISAINNPLQFENWGSYDYLRKATQKIGDWGAAAAKAIASSTAKMKSGFGASMKSVANTIANSFKSAMNSKAKNISDSASGIISTATNDMVKQAQKEQERYKKAYDYNTKLQKEYERKAKDKKASSAERKAAEKKAKEYAALAKKYKASADKFKDLATSYSRAGSTMKTAFTSAFNDKVNAAITSTMNAINSLAETYQKKYDAIISARTDFRDKMREISLGEYDDEKRQVVALTDYNVMTRQVKEYGANLEKLKKIMPQGMMDEILGMDTEEGLAYTQKLLSKGSAWLKDYAKSYSTFQNATTSVSTKYYQSAVNDLKSNYTKAVEKEFKNLQKNLKTIGQQVMQGFADGMKSKKTALDNAGKTLADSVIKTLKAKLKIHSPSKVMQGLGSYTGQGFVGGVEDEVKAAREAMQRLVELPQPQVAMASGAENLRLSDEYNYTSNRHYTFEAVTEIDGREVARSTAEYTEDELERRRRNSERIKGRR
jgi:tape measure domain-containing protein